MKKLIAISVMLALVAGAAFAQPSIGGNYKLGVFLLAAGDTVDGDKNTMAGNMRIVDYLTNVSWSGDNAGGMMRLYSKGHGWTPDYFSFIWWQPTDWVRIQMGQNADGDFGFQDIGGWGFNAEAMNSCVALNDYGGGDLPYPGFGYPGPHDAGGRTENAWYGGFGGLGASLSLTPADGMKINIAFPFAGQNTVGKTYLQSHLSFTYSLDVGTIKLATQFKGLNSDDELVIPDVFAAFYLAALDGMGIEIGLGFKNEFDLLAVGLGFRGNFGDLGLKVRTGFELPSFDNEADPTFGIGLLPSYNFGPATGFFNVGMSMDFGDVGDSLGWWVNPYFIIGANAGSFRVGFMLTGAKDDINWAVPIGWNVYF